MINRRRDLPTRSHASRLLLIVFVILSGVLLAPAQKKGGAAPCLKPSVAPPDTSCSFGSGCRDASFNGNGIALFEQLGTMKAVFTQPDGKVVGIGDGARTPDSPTLRDLLIMRLNPDGTPDTTFGDIDLSNPILRIGHTYIAVTSGSDFISSGALQADGKILAGGWSSAGGYWHVIRTLADGSLDPSFAGDGIVTVSATDGGGEDIKVQPDGKIVVGGGPNFTVTRLNSDGSFDGSFGVGGKVTYNASPRNGGSRLWSLAFQRVAANPSEDRIVIGGWSNTSANGNTSFALMRLRSNGAVDTTFGSSGKVNTTFFGTGDQIRELAIDPLNRIVAAGITRINSCSATDFGIARFLEGGQLDASFGTQGKASLDLYNDENSVYALTIQPDGRPIIGGNARVLASDSVNRRYYLTLVRYDTAGNLDATFGTGSAGPGVVTTMISGASQSSFLFSLHQQADGKIVAAGNSIEKPVFTRYLP